jgi:hypothetical protein
MPLHTCYRYVLRHNSLRLDLPVQCHPLVLITASQLLLTGVLSLPLYSFASVDCAGTALPRAARCSRRSEPCWSFDSWCGQCFAYCLALTLLYASRHDMLSMDLALSLWCPLVSCTCSDRRAVVSFTDCAQVRLCHVQHAEAHSVELPQRQHKSDPGLSHSQRRHARHTLLRRRGGAN